MESLLLAIESRAWYPILVAALVLLIQGGKALDRRWHLALWERIPRRLQWLPVTGVLLATSFVDAALAGETWQGALALAGWAVASSVLGIGGYHMGKRAGSGPTLKQQVTRHPFVWLVLLAPVLGSACASWQLQSCDKELAAIQARCAKWQFDVGCAASPVELCPEIVEQCEQEIAAACPD